MDSEQEVRQRGSAISGWLGGPGALPDGTRPEAESSSKLGLPADGPGSAARSGRKAAGLFIDWLAALLITHAILLPVHNPNSGLTNALQLVIFGFHVTLLQATTGQSIGQRFTGTRIASVDTPNLKTRWLVVRTVLLIIPPLILALITDVDGRGLHDRASSTVIIRV